MRTIKFRAKRIYNGKWAYGYIRSKLEYILDVNSDYAHCYYICEDKMEYKVEPDTIGQFTGMFDKNGEEIYDGDIVLIIHSPWAVNCEVKFTNGCFCIVSLANIDRGCILDSLSFCNKNWEIEIIGNIHDNPELLK